MITANQLQLLVTICDMSGAKESTLPDKPVFQESLKVLLHKKLLILENGIVNPTAKGKLCVEAARSEMNFTQILNKMNHRMLINLWHRLIEVSIKRGVHLNVAFKNLEDDNMHYLISEMNRAIESKEEKSQIENIQEA